MLDDMSSIKIVLYNWRSEEGRVGVDFSKESEKVINQQSSQFQSAVSLKHTWFYNVCFLCHF